MRRAGQCGHCGDGCNNTRLVIIACSLQSPAQAASAHKQGACNASARIPCAAVVMYTYGLYGTYARREHSQLADGQVFLCGCACVSAHTNMQANV